MIIFLGCHRARADTEHTVTQTPTLTAKRTKNALYVSGGWRSLVLLDLSPRSFDQADVVRAIIPFRVVKKPSVDFVFVWPPLNPFLEEALQDHSTLRLIR